MATTPAEILNISDERRVGASHLMTLTLKIRGYDRSAAPTRGGTSSRSRSIRTSASSRPPPGEVAPRRDAHVPSFVRPGDLRLRRDGDQRNALACKVLVKDVAPKVTIEPIRGLRVLKDLIVDMEPFFDGYRAALPFLVNDEPTPDGERVQAPEDRHRYDDTTKCILRRLSDLLPDLLGGRDLHRTGGDRERAPLHLRFPRPGAEGAPVDPLGEDRRVPMPHDLQLHRGISAWDRVTKAIQEVKRACSSRRTHR